VIWKIPEELKRELAKLGSQPLYADYGYMSSIGYISDRQYYAYVVNRAREHPS
jgi:hypothetical protein